jgi:monoamine oxidase
MDTRTIDTVIIGGGLSGIYAASLLQRKKASFIVLEARNRIGGRIVSPEHRGFFADMGPSWYWPEIQPKMARLVESLGLIGYRQFEDGLGRFQRHDGTVQTVRGYAMEPPSWRVHGGMNAIIERLCVDIPSNALLLNHPVSQIEKRADGVLVSVGELERAPWAQFKARRVILALPPRLAAAAILFYPELSHELTQAMLHIGTWMAGHAKFFAFYEEPFWRHSGLSGEAFSECGPLNEIHDGSSDGDGPFGMTGFVGLPAVQRRQHPHLTEEILTQLARIFGAQASLPAAFFYRDWAQEPFTATGYDQPPMYEHPLYQPPAGRTAIWDDTLLFSSTETSTHHGGYLEGALAAAERAAAGIRG